MYLFNRLAGYTEKQLQDTVPKPLIALAREKYARPSTVELLETLALLNTIGFLIARNPYERLVSGYRDKMVKIHHQLFIHTYKNYRKRY